MSTLPMLLLVLFLLVFLIAIPAAIYLFAKLFPQKPGARPEATER